MPEIKPLFKRETSVIVMMDMTDFGQGVRDLEDEKIVAFLSAYYDEMGEVVQRHGGRLVKYLGDAVLATFPESKVLQAVQCGMEAVKVFGGFAQRRDIAVGLSVGVHLGEVSAGTFGHASYLQQDVVGRAVNLAGVACAKGEGLHITEACYTKLDPAPPQLHETGSVDVSWLDEPVKLYGLSPVGLVGPVTKPAKRF